jgi:hypothetical protein
MYGYLHNGQVVKALATLMKISSIDGCIKTAAKYGSLLSTYEEPTIDAVIRQWDSRIRDTEFLSVMDYSSGYDF